MRVKETGVELFAESLHGSGEREVSTTMAFVRIVTLLLRDKELGKYIVPMIPADDSTSGPNFSAHANFINRELSWLEFNRRVLEEAQDPEQPLLERVKLLGIVSSNPDECFEIRAPGT